MEKIVEKLIEKLHEEKEAHSYDERYVKGVNASIKIVSQLTERYKDKDCSKCSRRSWYQKGYADAEKKYIEEHNNEFCEWKQYSVIAGIEFYENCKRILPYHLYDEKKYCPYCGKKIKVVE